MPRTGRAVNHDKEPGARRGTSPESDRRSDQDVPADFLSQKKAAVLGTWPVVPSNRRMCPIASLAIRSMRHRQFQCARKMRLESADAVGGATGQRERLLWCRVALPVYRD